MNFPTGFSFRLPISTTALAEQFNQWNCPLSFVLHRDLEFTQYWYLVPSIWCEVNWCGLRNWASLVVVVYIYSGSKGGETPVSSHIVTSFPFICRSMQIEWALSGAEYRVNSAVHCPLCIFPHIHNLSHTESACVPYNSYILLQANVLFYHKYSMSHCCINWWLPPPFW